MGDEPLTADEEAKVQALASMIDKLAEETMHMIKRRFVVFEWQPALQLVFLGMLTRKAMEMAAELEGKSRANPG